MNDFPGGPVAKNPGFRAEGTGLMPGWGTQIPHTAHILNEQKELQGEGI